MHSKLVILIRYMVALGLGVALSFAYAPWNIGWIAWFFPVGLICLIWSLPRAEGKKAGRKNFWRGFRLTFVLALGFWFRDTGFVAKVSEQGAGWAAGFGTNLAGALFLTPWMAFYGGWANTLGRARRIEPKSQPAGAILKVSALHGLLWCALEWGRGLGRVSFGWDGLGVSFLEDGFVLAQAADLVGVNGLSFIPVFCGLVLVQTLRAFHMEALHSHRRVHWEVVCAMLLLALTFTYGTFRLRALHDAETFSLRSLIVQQNVPISFTWDPGIADTVYTGFAEELDEAFSRIEERAVAQIEETGEGTLEMPDLVIFPESAFPNPLWVDERGVPMMEQENWSFFDEHIRPHGDFLLISGVNQFPAIADEEGNYDINMEGPFYNAVGFFPGEFLSYRMKPKNHLMPFGEYLPLSELGPVKWLVSKIYAYSAGVKYGGSFNAATEFVPEPAEIRGDKFSIIPSVCYEDAVSVRVRAYLRDEPQMIVNVTNDGWFTETPCAEKHFQNARFRAIEYRRPLVRAANTGVSGVVNLTGASVHPVTKEPQIIQGEDGSYEVKGSIEGLVQLPKKPIMTVYALTGDVFCWGGGILVLLLSVYWLFKPRTDLH